MDSLNAPEYVLYSKIKATLGGDPYLSIPEMTVEGCNYTINIITFKTKQAYALKELLKKKYEFGNITVDLVISSQEQGEILEVDKNQRGLKKLVDWALGNNFYYVLSILMDRKNPSIPPTYGDVALIFRKKIVRYYINDMCEAYGAVNEVAAEAFRGIFEEKIFDKYRLSYSTNVDMT